MTLAIPSIHLPRLYNSYQNRKEFNMRRHVLLNASKKYSHNVSKTDSLQTSLQARQDQLMTTPDRISAFPTGTPRFVSVMLKSSPNPDELHKPEEIFRDKFTSICIELNTKDLTSPQSQKIMLQQISRFLAEYSSYIGLPKCPLKPGTRIRKEGSLTCLKTEDGRMIHQLKRHFPIIIRTLNGMKIKECIDTLGRQLKKYFDDDYGPYDKIIGNGASGTVRGAIFEGPLDEKGEQEIRLAATKKISLFPVFDQNENTEQLISNYYDFLTEILMEAYALEFLTHPNLVKTYCNVFAFDKNNIVNAYLSQEFFSCGDLFDFLNKLKQLTAIDDIDYLVPKLKKNVAKFKYLVFLEVLRAIVYLHGKGYIHRDIKPENVFLSLSTSEGLPKITCKLGDFGLLAKIGTEIAVSFSGTPEYTAPELIANNWDTVKKWYEDQLKKYDEFRSQNREHLLIIAKKADQLRRDLVNMEKAVNELKNEECGTKLDCFALGCLLYELFHSADPLCNLPEFRKIENTDITFAVEDNNDSAVSVPVQEHELKCCEKYFLFKNSLLGTRNRAVNGPIDLIESLLKRNPAERLSSEEALNHEAMQAIVQERDNLIQKLSGINFGNSKTSIFEFIENLMSSYFPG